MLFLLTGVKPDWVVGVEPCLAIRCNADVKIWGTEEYSSKGWPVGQGRQESFGFQRCAWVCLVNSTPHCGWGHGAKPRIVRSI